AQRLGREVRLELQVRAPAVEHLQCEAQDAGDGVVRVDELARGARRRLGCGRGGRDRRPHGCLARAGLVPDGAEAGTGGGGRRGRGDGHRSIVGERVPPRGPNEPLRGRTVRGRSGAAGGFGRDGSGPYGTCGRRCRRSGRIGWLCVVRYVRVAVRQLGSDEPLRGRTVRAGSGAAGRAGPDGSGPYGTGTQLRCGSGRPGRPGSVPAASPLLDPNGSSPSCRSGRIASGPYGTGAKRCRGRVRTSCSGSERTVRTASPSYGRAVDQAATEPLVRLLVRAGAALQRYTRSAAAAHGLSATALEVLGALVELGEVSQRDLAGHLRLAPATLTPVLDGLERAGSVTRVRDGVDRRVVRAAITPRG